MAAEREALWGGWDLDESPAEPSARQADDETAVDHDPITEPLPVAEPDPVTETAAEEASPAEEPDDWYEDREPGYAHAFTGRPIGSSVSALTFRAAPTPPWYKTKRGVIG